MNIPLFYKEQLSDFFTRLKKRNADTNLGVLEVVAKIIENVKKNGDRALLEYTSKFDGVDLEKIEVSDEEFKFAYETIESGLLSVIRNAKKNIYEFHMKQRRNSWIETAQNGVILGQMMMPLSVVGIYVPGGTAPLPSSVLMNAIPAKVAGVERIIMCTPPDKKGNVNPAILVAAKETGVDKVFKVGGAQAVAAMAYGTESIPKTDKITGPGNRYVASAKKQVFGDCDIDMVAGPSEIMIVADSSANPKYLAADLLSQAEHDFYAASILVATSKTICQKVQEEVKIQLSATKRREVAEKSLENYGAIVFVDTLKEALNLVEKVSPEHLELCVEKPFEILGKVKNAGAVFLGNWSPEPLGDYYAGPNHVLPTSGTARFASPLGVDDFIKKMSIISYSKKALENVASDVIRFAEAEGLGAHANSIKIRVEQEMGN